MPRMKRKSLEMKRRESKLKRKRKNEDQIKQLEILNSPNKTGNTDEFNVKELDETERLSEGRSKESRVEKHAEYVRNYRRNMPEERKRALRVIAAQRMAQKRKAMSEEKKAAIRAADRLRIALKRKNMSEEEKLAQREYHRQRMAFKRRNMSEEEKKDFRETQRWRMALKRQSMSEEQKRAAREADRRRVALKRKKWKEEADRFHAAMLKLAIQRQHFLRPPVDLADSSSDDDAPEDIQRFLAITLITGHSIISN